ncbi:MAG: NAD-dependent epimerase/dehydratase family protein [Chloroflexota bacterium]
MKILLTGATGNVGGHVLPLLLKRGHHVRCLVFDSNNERKIVQGWKHKPEVVWGDIQDERVVESALGGVEAVVHLAAIIPPMTDQNPRLAYGVNVNGTRNLVNAASKQAKRVRFIFTSTYDVYGNTQDLTPPRKVTLPVNPQEEYARHKVEAEKIIQSGNVDWCIFRLASAIPVEMSTKYQSMMFDVPLDDRLEYIHPADAALAICNAVEHAEVWGKVLHLGGGPGCQLRERDIVQGAFEAIGIGALPEKYFNTQHYYTDWLDTEESQRLLNYQRHTFNDHLEGLKKSLGWQIPLIKLLRPLIRYSLLRQSKYHK